MEVILHQSNNENHAKHINNRLVFCIALVVTRVELVKFSDNTIEATKQRLYNKLAHDELKYFGWWIITWWTLKNYKIVKTGHKIFSKTRHNFIYVRSIVTSALTEMFSSRFTVSERTSVTA